MFFRPHSPFAGPGLIFIRAKETSQYLIPKPLDQQYNDTHIFDGSARGTVSHVAHWICADKSNAINCLTLWKVKNLSTAAEQLSCKLTSPELLPEGPDGKTTCASANWDISYYSIVENFEKQEQDECILTPYNIILMRWNC
jgi:hypothetical protein